MIHCLNIFAEQINFNLNEREQKKKNNLLGFGHSHFVKIVDFKTLERWIAGSIDSLRMSGSRHLSFFRDLSPVSDWTKDRCCRSHPVVDERTADATSQSVLTEIQQREFVFTIFYL